jgi:predicted MFS family arabinose efflux permease
MLRLLAFGLVAILLLKHLRACGFSEAVSSGLLALAFAGDIAVSLLMTTHADRWGRRRVLFVGALLMAMSGVLFAVSQNYWILLFAAFVGVISPSAAEVGPFLAIEQSSLTKVVSEEKRTSLFAWYHVAGFTAASCGAVLAGQILTRLANAGWADIAAHRVMFIAYGVIGSLIGVLFLFVSRNVEIEVFNGIRKEESPGSDGAQESRSDWLGLRRSHWTVVGLSALFAVDAFAGGFLLDTILAQWLRTRFGASESEIGFLLAGGNMLGAVSALVAGWLGKKIGLLATMVVTHLPSNILVLLLPWSPSFFVAALVWWARSSISQMDIPARQAFTMAVVEPDERSAASGITGIARSVGRALAPAVPLIVPLSIGGFFAFAGGLKIAYDIAIWFTFRDDREKK